MNMQCNRTLLRGVVALITVVMRVQSVFKTVVFSKRKLLYNKIQTMFDQALLPNTNALF